MAKKGKQIIEGVKRGAKLIDLILPDNNASAIIQPIGSKLYVRYTEVQAVAAPAISQGFSVGQLVLSTPENYKLTGLMLGTTYIDRAGSISVPNFVDVSIRGVSLNSPPNNGLPLGGSNPPAQVALTIGQRISLDMRAQADLRFTPIMYAQFAAGDNAVLTMMIELESTTQ